MALLQWNRGQNVNSRKKISQIKEKLEQMGRVDKICHCCGDADESLEHLLFNCEKAKMYCETSYVPAGHSSSIRGSDIKTSNLSEIINQILPQKQNYDTNQRIRIAFHNICFAFISSIRLKIFLPEK
ncbi:RNA-directed DNA polymerase (reversetranscriptase)-related family protein [Striga asiatica]|uniref:RNA-directed DNA polymerase (Reversetranscriptase)-related family protein n=1 Tax=Striga asiatica TaxID=4170 RepID=A0A5A7R491_STRAF|nr:RNA-directed DNA polymerase (reversetranscriptase)-related family protein [Striga asiatica]